MACSSLQPIEGGMQLDPQEFLDAVIGGRSVHRLRDSNQPAVFIEGSAPTKEDREGLEKQFQSSFCHQPPNFVLRKEGKEHEVDANVRNSARIAMESLTQLNSKSHHAASSVGAASSRHLRRGILVLCTGDGNTDGMHEDTIHSFPKLVCAALDSGLYVEVVGFESSIKKKFFTIQREHRMRHRLSICTVGFLHHRKGDKQINLVEQGEILYPRITEVPNDSDAKNFMESVKRYMHLVCQGPTGTSGAAWCSHVLDDDYSNKAPWLAQITGHQQRAVEYLDKKVQKKSQYRPASGAGSDEGDLASAHEAVLEVLRDIHGAKGQTLGLPAVRSMFDQLQRYFNGRIQEYSQKADGRRRTDVRRNTGLLDVPDAMDAATVQGRTGWVDMAKSMTDKATSYADLLHARIAGDMIDLLRVWDDAKSVPVDTKMPSARGALFAALGVERQSVDVRPVLLRHFEQRVSRHANAFQRDLDAFVQQGKFLEKYLHIKESGGCATDCGPVAKGAAAEHKGRVLMLSGRTGSGKSTQIPQTLLLFGHVSSSPGNRMLIVQPSEAAAGLLAARVASQLSEHLGETVTHVSARALQDGTAPWWGWDKSSLVYCDEITALGILAMQLQALQQVDRTASFADHEMLDARLPSLREFGVVMVDEVHERGVACDVLQGLLKTVQANDSRKKMKEKTSPVVIISSATMGGQKESPGSRGNLPEFGALHEYWLPASGSDERDAKLLQLESQSYKLTVNHQDPEQLYKHVEAFVDEYKDVTCTRFSFLGERSPPVFRDSKSMKQFTPVESVRFDQISKIVNSSAYAAMREVMQLKKSDNQGSLLVFLPGEGDVRRCMECYKWMMAAANGGKAPRPGEVVSLTKDNLNGSIDAMEPHGSSPVVYFATRDAESSITIPGLTCVIDSGFDWQEVYDPNLRVSQRRLCRISKVSAIQRAGRAARTRPGRCIRLYSEPTFDSLPTTRPPGVQRCSITRGVLALYAAGSSPLKFPWIERPSDERIQQAVDQLVSMGLINLDEASRPAGQQDDCLDPAAKVTADGYWVIRTGLKPWLGALAIRAAKDITHALDPDPPSDGTDCGTTVKSSGSEALSSSTGAASGSEALSSSTGAASGSEALSTSTGAASSSEALSTSTGAASGSEALSTSTGAASGSEALSSSTGAASGSEALSTSTGAASGSEALSTSTGAASGSEALSTSTGAASGSEALSTSTGAASGSEAIPAAIPDASASGQVHGLLTRLIQARFTLTLVALVDAGASRYSSRLLDRAAAVASPRGDLLTLLRVYVAWQRIGLPKRQRSATIDMQQHTLLRGMYTEDASRVLGRIFKNVSSTGFKRIVHNSMQHAQREPLGKMQQIPDVPQLSAVGEGVIDAIKEYVNVGSSGKSFEACFGSVVQPLSVSFGISQDGTPPRDPDPVETHVAKEVARCLRYNLARRTYGTSGLYEMLVHGANDASRFVLARIHGMLAKTGASDVVVYERMQRKGDYLMLNAVRLEEEELAAVEIATSGVEVGEYTDIVVRGLDTATYRSLLGQECDEVERVALSQAMQIEGKMPRLYLESPWSRIHEHAMRVKHGDLRVWVKASQQKELQTKFESLVSQHAKLQDSFLDVAGVLRGSDGSPGHASYAVLQAGAVLLRPPVFAPVDELGSNLSESKLAPSSSEPPAHPFVESGSLDSDREDCENSCQVLVKHTAVADESNPNKPIFMDWMGLLNAFQAKIDSRQANGDESMGTDDSRNDRKYNDVTFRELDSPCQQSCRAVFTACAPRTAQSFKDFAAEQPDLKCKWCRPRLHVELLSHEPPQEAARRNHYVYVSWLRHRHQGCCTITVTALSKEVEPQWIAIAGHNNLNVLPLLNGAYFVSGFGTRKHPAEVQERLDRTLEQADRHTKPRVVQLHLHFSGIPESAKHLHPTQQMLTASSGRAMRGFYRAIQGSGAALGHIEVEGHAKRTAQPLGTHLDKQESWEFCGMEVTMKKKKGKRATGGGGCLDIVTLGLDAPLREGGSPSFTAIGRSIQDRMQLHCGQRRYNDAVPRRTQKPALSQQTETWRRMSVVDRFMSVNNHIRSVPIGGIENIVVYNASNHGKGGLVCACIDVSSAEEAAELVRELNRPECNAPSWLPIDHSRLQAQAMHTIEADVHPTGQYQVGNEVLASYWAWAQQAQPARRPVPEWVGDQFGFHEAHQARLTHGIWLTGASGPSLYRSTRRMMVGVAHFDAEPAQEGFLWGKDVMGVMLQHPNIREEMQNENHDELQNRRMWLASQFAIDGSKSKSGTEELMLSARKYGVGIASRGSIRDLNGGHIRGIHSPDRCLVDLYGPKKQVFAYVCHVEQMLRIFRASPKVSLRPPAPTVMRKQLSSSRTLLTEADRERVAAQHKGAAQIVNPLVLWSCRPKISPNLGNEDGVDVAPCGSAARSIQKPLVEEVTAVSEWLHVQLIRGSKPCIPCGAQSISDEMPMPLSTIEDLAGLESAALFALKTWEKRNEYLAVEYGQLEAAALSSQRETAAKAASAYTGGFAARNPSSRSIVKADSARGLAATGGAARRDSAQATGGAARRDSAQATGGAAAMLPSPRSGGPAGRDQEQAATGGAAGVSASSQSGSARADKTSGLGSTDRAIRGDDGGVRGGRGRGGGKRKRRRKRGK